MTRKNSRDKLIAVVHADHLADRRDPANSFWNNYYEYELSHLQRLDTLVVATSRQRDNLLYDFPECENKIKAIPVGGIDDSVIFNKRTKVSTPVRLITMSRLATEKHIDLIVKVVLQLHKNYQQVILDIYGGSGYANLEKLINASKDQEFISLKGQTNQPVSVYPDYDAFISGSFSEEFVLTYIEALNSGIPVVTFNARFSAQEIIKDGQNCFLQPFNRNDEGFNVSQLIKGIKRLQDADYSKLQENIQILLQLYQEKNIAKMWRTLIDRL